MLTETETGPTTFAIFKESLVRTVLLERTNARHLDADERRESDPEASTVTNHTIRLATDFARCPNLVQTPEIPFATKHQRNKLCSHLWSVVLLHIEKLACDAARINSPGLDEYDIFQSLDHPFRKILWQAYTLGRDVGRRDGQHVYMTILGGFPSISKVYSFEEYRHEYLAQEPPGVVRVKVRVDTPVTRREKYDSLMGKLENVLELLLTQIEGAVKLRCDQIQRGHMDTEVGETLRHRQILNKQSAIRNNISMAMCSSFEVGRFDGHEVGQNAAKDGYKHLDCHRDAKIYSAATTLDGYGIAVDLHAAEECQCGNCHYCIHQDTEKRDGKWPDLYQRVEDDIDEIRMQLAIRDKDGRAKKRFRHTL